MKAFSFLIIFILLIIHSKGQNTDSEGFVKNTTQESTSIADGVFSTPLISIYYGNKELGDKYESSIINPKISIRGSFNESDTIVFYHYLSEDNSELVFQEEKVPVSEVDIKRLFNSNSQPLSNINSSDNKENQTIVYYHYTTDENGEVISVEEIQYILPFKEEK